jgi:hypothetical protein
MPRIPPIHALRSLAGTVLLASVMAWPEAAGRNWGTAALSAQQARPAVARGSAQDDLNRTADAILALKSTRFTLTREGKPAFLDEKNGITFTAADCGYASPDRVSCNVKVSLRNGTIVQLTRVWVPEGTFQSNPLTRQFAKVPPDANFNGALLFARAGIPDILRTSVQKAENAGRERIQNRDTVHLKGEVTGAKLSPFIGSALKPEQLYPVEVWIEESSAIPVKFHVSELDGNAWLIDLVAVNEPVDIPTPQVPPPAPGRP